MEYKLEIKSRNITISKIRMISMFMIVFLHMDDGGFFGHIKYVDYILDAGVGIFFCISAWLYGQKTVNESIKYFYIRNCLKVLGPLWLLCCLVIPVNIFVFHKEFVGLKIVVNSILGLCTYGCIDGCRHLWFITYILFCYLITPLLEFTDISSEKNTLKQFLTKGCLFIGLVLMLGMYKVIGLSVFYPIEYIVVYFISRRTNYYKKDDTQRLQYLIILAGALFTGIWFVYVWDGFNHLPLSSSVEILQSQFEVFTSAALFFGGYNLLNKFGKKNVNGIYHVALSFFDKYSYSIYLTHAYFIWNDKLNFMYLSSSKILNFILTISEVLFIGFCFQNLYDIIEGIIAKKLPKNKKIDFMDIDA